MMPGRLYEPPADYGLQRVNRNGWSAG